MKIKQISEALTPVINQAKTDNDKYAFVYFSRSEDSYSGEFDLDSGDALIVIEELVKHAGIDPQVLIEMLSAMDEPVKPFRVTLEVAESA